MELTPEQELVAAIRKGDSEEIRVIKEVFNGRRCVDVRVWFEPRDGGEKIATKRGIKFDEKLLPSVIDALNAAMKQAQGEREG